MNTKNFLPVSVETTSIMVSGSQYEMQLYDCAQMIQDGLNATEAGTGYPMDRLYGGAHTNAVLAAIGGGPINKGGTGMAGGLQTLLKYAEASTALRIQQQCMDQLPLD